MTVLSMTWPVLMAREGFLCLQKSVKELENSYHTVIPGFCPKVQRHCAVKEGRNKGRSVVLQVQILSLSQLQESWRNSYKKAGEADTDTRLHQCMFHSCHEQMDL